MCIILQRHVKKFRASILAFPTDTPHSEQDRQNVTSLIISMISGAIHGIKL